MIHNRRVMLSRRTNLGEVYNQRRHPSSPGVRDRGILRGKGAVLKFRRLLVDHSVTRGKYNVVVVQRVLNLRRRMPVLRRSERSVEYLCRRFRSRRSIKLPQRSTILTTLRASKPKTSAEADICRVGRGSGFYRD